jgi:pilus assembly protein Flp/PilA
MRSVKIAIVSTAANLKLRQRGAVLRGHEMANIYRIWLRGFLRLPADNRAVTALEYGLIAALIAVVIITSVTLIGTNLAKTFTTISGKI